MAAPYPEIASGKPLLRQKRARSCRRTRSIIDSPMRASARHNGAFSSRDKVGCDTRSRTLSGSDPQATTADVQDSDGGLELLETLFSQQRLSKNYLSRCHGRHPAPPRDRDRQAIRWGQGLRRPARRWVVKRTIPGSTAAPDKDWGNLNHIALAFLKLVSIRLLLRKLYNPS